MNITINEEILSKYNLTLEEFLVLYLCAKEINIKHVIQNLISLGIIERDIYNDANAVISDNTKNLIASIIIDSDSAIINKETEFLDLANEMRALFPEGKKPGTTYYWKDSAPIIAKKLKTLVLKFGTKLKKDKVLEATKRYVESFKGDFSYMQLLKYFILKTDKNSGEMRSELLSYLENAEQENLKEDWTSTLV